MDLNLSQKALPANELKYVCGGNAELAASVLDNAASSIIGNHNNRLEEQQIKHWADTFKAQRTKFANSYNKGVQNQNDEWMKHEVPTIESIKAVFQLSRNKGRVYNLNPAVLHKIPLA